MDSKIIKGVIDKQTKPLKDLEKILQEVGHFENVDSMINIVDQTTQKQTEPDEERKIRKLLPSREKLAEVHCAAICFDEKGHILLGKRPATKKQLPGVWEFGCSQLKYGQSIEECLRQSYQEDFGAKLEFDSRLIPVISYKMQKKDTNIPGIVFLAQVKNPQDAERNFSKEKHSEIRWFEPSITDLKQIDPKEYVPDFRDTVERAVQLRNGIAKDQPPRPDCSPGTA